MDLTRNRDELIGSQFTEENDGTTFEKQVHLLTVRLLAVTKKAQSDFIVENSNLKRELNIAEQEITNLKIQIRKLETDQNMVICFLLNLLTEIDKFFL